MSRDVIDAVHLLRVGIDEVPYRVVFKRSSKLTLRIRWFANIWIFK